MAAMPDLPIRRPALPIKLGKQDRGRMQLAAIDLGSNSFRLEIASSGDGRYRRADYLKETVRLGAGLDENKRLVGPAVDRGLSCLRQFRDRLADLPARQVRAVATQTLREASNRDEFLRLASEALGQPIEVISGREEARLIYRGVAGLQPSEASRLVIDIGGRSTEMILGQGRHIAAAESYGVGSVSLSQRFFAQGRFTMEAFKAARIAAAAEFEEARDLFRPSEWTEALGSSGTAGAVSQLLAAQGKGTGAITMDGLEWCIEACLVAGTADQLVMRGLKADRAPVIGGGLAILAALFDLFGLQSLAPAKGALRQGLIFDLVERLDADDRPDHHDLRDDSVKALQQRFGVDLEQATRVRRTAQAIHAQLAPQADHEQQRELAWSADLHEIGMAVSHHDHHRHSAYLIAHVDAAGFSQSQQRRLAQLLLGQRGGLRKVQELCPDEARVRQLLALRLAVLINHPRIDPPVGLQVALSTHAKGRTLALRWPGGWAVELPRMVYLLDQEAACWASQGDVEVSTGARKDAGATMT
jgi:exopolyphosphatase/guanosine-5'-triphosphate,3'-diphosphate pyrophosphatase